MNENNTGVTNDVNNVIQSSVTDDINISNTNFIEKPPKFKSLFLKIRNSWRSLSVRGKFVAILFTLLVLITGTLAFYLYVKTGRVPSPFEKKEVTIAEYGDWEKLVIPERQKPFFTLTLTTDRKFGILPRESFILKTDSDMDIDFLKENIASTIPVDITAVNSKEFRIVPAQNAGLDQLVNVKFSVEGKSLGNYTFDRDYSWGFQTQGKFSVVGTIPDNEKTEVPVNTGIEIAFSQDGYRDPTSLISISPSLNFRTEIHADRVAIIPLDPLKEQTVYTVTLAKGLNLVDRNDPIAENYAFSFQTGSNSSQNAEPFFDLRDDFQQISPDKKLVTKIYTSRWNNDLSVKTEVYKFNSVSQFLASRSNIDRYLSSWHYYYPEKDRFNPTGLEKVINTSLKVQVQENLEFLELPDNLSEGYYLVNFLSPNGKKVEELWVQSTNLTGFVSVGKEQTLVWVNDVNGSSGGGATVRLSGLGQEFLAYDNGTLSFNTPKEYFEKKKNYIEIISGEKSVVLPVDSMYGRSAPGQKTSDDYWSYLYSERYLYKQDDTVYFFGVIKDRDTGGIPANVTVSISGGDEFNSQTVFPASDGSFIGSYKLDNLPYGWYSLNLKVNDVSVKSISFSVKEYVKPEMKIDVTAPKKAIFAGEKVEFSGVTGFFEGTPATNIPIIVNDDQNKKTENLVSGSNGEFNYNYQTKYEESPNYYNYYPRYESVYFSPAGALEGSVSATGSVYVFGSHLLMESEGKTEDHKAKLTASVKNITLDNINSGRSNDYSGSVVGDKEVAILIKKSWYEKRENGTYYDFIEKVTRKKYDYIRHEEVSVEHKLKTNSNGRIDYTFDLEEEKSYLVELTVKDNEGRSTKTSRNFYYDNYAPNESENSSFPSLDINKEESTYSVDEEVGLEILAGNSKYVDTESNKFLFILASRGRQEIVLSDHPDYKFNFSDRHIPNVYIGAYIFTGEHYVQVNSPCRWNWYCSDYYYDSGKHYFSGLIISYKKEDSEFDLTISPEKDKYMPGETAKISVKVEKDGSPVGNANVNLVLVDQALAALNAVRTPSILANLYESVDSFIFYNYSSHEPVLPDPSQAERGGGGGDDREIFKDAPFFDRELTDSNGMATFTFVLPDNITSWLVYAQAVNEKIESGWDESKLTVTKDFFVTNNLPAKFLVSDKPMLTGGSYGKGLNQNNNIQFSATFYKGDTELSKTQRIVKAFSAVTFPLPNNLSPGSYSTLLHGETGDKKDGVKLPFTVVDSRLNFSISKKTEVNEGETLKKIDLTNVRSDKPIKLIVSDIGKGVYYYDLNRFCFYGGGRLEKMAAKVRSSQILNDKFEDNYCDVVNTDILSYQSSSGGLGQVVWGGPDLSSTAWVISVKKDLFEGKPAEKEKMINYLENLLSNSHSGNLQKIYASWALTNLGVPKVIDLKNLVSSAQTFEEKAISAFALNDSGNSEEAREIYLDLLANYAYRSSPYIRFQAEFQGKNQTDSYLQNTSYALLLGSLVEKKYNQEMFNYIRDHRSELTDVVIDLSYLSFINEELGKLPDDETAFTFNSGSLSVQKTLSKGRSDVINLTQNDLNNFILKVNTGKAEANFIYFINPTGLLEIPTDPKLSIKRTYVKTAGSGEIRAGETVRVDLKVDLDDNSSPKGCYTVTDHLPSGLRYLNNSGAYGLHGYTWVEEVEPNVIEGYFCNSPWWREYGRDTITYFARASSVGEYTAEPAIMQSQTYLSNFAVTDSQKVKIIN